LLTNFIRFFLLDFLHGLKKGEEKKRKEKKRKQKNGRLISMRIHNDDVTEDGKKKLKIKIKRLPSCHNAHSAGYRIGYRHANISKFATLVN